MRRLVSGLAFLALVGCGSYQLGGPKAAFRRIEVTPVRNSTARPGTHAVLHNKLVEAFAADPRVRIGGGDAVLTTEIVQYQRDGLSTRSTDAYLFTSYRIGFTVRCTLTTEGGRKVLFKDRNFTASAVFQPAGDSAAEELSLGTNLFADIAAQIREAATTAW